MLALSRKKQCIEPTFVTTPAKPKKTYSERDTSNNHRWQTPFRDGDVVIGSELSVIAWLQKNDENSSTKHADNHTKVGKTPHAGRHMVNALEDYRVGRKEKVKKTSRKLVRVFI